MTGSKELDISYPVIPYFINFGGNPLPQGWEYFGQCGFDKDTSMRVADAFGLTQYLKEISVWGDNFIFDESVFSVNWKVDSTFYGKDALAVSKK